jgi:hypothetical protein
MKLPSDDKGVSEVLGYVIILGIVMTALALVLLIVFPSIQNTKDDGQHKEIEQGFTVVDSRLSKARFSTSIFQEAPFNLEEGTVTVDDDIANSYIIVTEESTAGGTPQTTQLYPLPVGSNVPLGTIKCVTDAGEVAYQGGGVWALYDKGLPTERVEMISPPDFDYNGVTLTLPITRIVQNDVINDPNNPNTFQGTDTIYGKDSIIFIDSSSTGTIDLKFPVSNSLVYTNPLAQNDNKIKVTVKSDYYKGWASFFKERIEDKNSVVMNDATKTVSVTLSTGNGRQQKHIQNGPHGDNNLDTQHMKTTETEPIDIFMFNMVPSDPGEGVIGNALQVYYDTYSDTTKNPRLIIQISRTTGPLNKAYAQVVFIFTYNTPAGTYTEKFVGYIPFQRKSEHEFVLDMLDTNTVPYLDADGTYYDIMEYFDNANSPETSISWGTTWDPVNGLVYNPAGNNIDMSITNPNDPRSKFKSLYSVTQHYMALMGNAFPYKVGDANSGPVYVNTKTTHLDADGKSSVVLEFSSDQQIKYLYVTEAKLTTGVSSKSA